MVLRLRDFCFMIGIDFIHVNWRLLSHTEGVTQKGTVNSRSTGKTTASSILFHSQWRLLLAQHETNIALMIRIIKLGAPGSWSVYS
jgi:hypothetical protein